VRVGSSERMGGARRVDGTRRLARGAVEAEHHGPAGNGRGREEVAQRAVRCVDARAAVAGVRLDVRSRMRAGAVETGVRQCSCPRQQELEQCAEQPEGARPEGAPGYADHAGLRTSFRRITAPTSTTPYMHTISGPVGRSPASDSHRPRIEASAPEPQEM
jgi:hypothetical protein